MNPEELECASVIRSAGDGARLLTARGAGMRVVSIASNIALIALVTPAQLGLLAVVRGIAGLAGDTSDLGFAWALLRRRDPPSVEEYRTLAGIQLTLVLAFLAVTLVVPSLLGAGTASPQWHRWMPLVLLALLTVPFGTGARIRIERTMDFRRIALADLSSVLLQNVALLGFAVAGEFSRGVFVATGGTILYSNLLLWWWSRGPAPGFRWAAWRRLGREFAGFTVGHVGSLLNASATPILIATLFGLPVAGLWSFATRLGNVIQLAFEGFRRAAIPAAGRLVDAPHALAQLVQQSFVGAARLTLPLIAACCAALPVVGWLLPQWSPAVPLSQLYVLAYGLAGIVGASIMPAAVARTGYRAILAEQFAPIAVGWSVLVALALVQRPVIGAVVLPMYTAMIAAVWYSAEPPFRPRWSRSLQTPMVALLGVCAVVAAGEVVQARAIFIAPAAAAVFMGVSVAPMALRPSDVARDAGQAG